MSALLDIIAFGVVRALVFLLAILPRRAALLFARGLVTLILLFFPRARGVALRNLSIAFPEKTTAEREEIYRRSLWVLAANLVGFAEIPRYTREHCEVVAADNSVVQQLRNAVNGEQGVLVVVGHLGTFERNLQLWQQLIGPCAVLARGFGLPRLDRWWNGRREFWGATVFARKGGYAESLRRLSDGETVLMLCDQNVKRAYAIFAPFFGLAAATTKTPAVAAARTGCKVLFLSSFSDELGVYRTDLEELRFDQNIEPELAMYELTAQFNRCFERVIRANPEQWFWIHRRWKTRPEGEPENLYSAASAQYTGASGEGELRI